MAARPYWKGYLKLSLVTCPVQMEPARTATGTLRLHTINRKTGNRIESRYVDAGSGKAVPDEDLAKGYPLDEERHVVLEDDELDAVALDSTRTIDMERFIPAADLPWVWLDRPHFLTPAAEVGEEAFAVVREAMVRTGTVALSRLVLYRREHAVALVPRGKGMVLWTLRYADEVREPEAGTARAEPKAVRLVTRFIDEHTADWSDNLVDDPVQDRLEKLIAGKTATPRPSRAQPDSPPEPTGSNVVSIMEALKRSVAAGKKKKA
ncbi:MAG TPA: Ku protein [Amaricoccus sp.]|nr:Ku protein [Amaricoccus sp.]